MTFPRLFDVIIVQIRTNDIRLISVLTREREKYINQKIICISQE